MAENENKNGLGEEQAEEESKEWQWDGITPEAPIEGIEISLPEEPETEAAEEETESAQETESSEAEAEIEVESENSDEEADENEEEHPDGCCIICGQKIRNSKSTLYCNDCRDKYMKVNFGATHIILSVIMAFVCVIAIVFFSATVKIASNISRGDKYMKAGQLADALDSYNNVATTAAEYNSNVNSFLQGISKNFKTVTVFDKGNEIVKKQAVILMKTMTIDYQEREAFMTAYESGVFSDSELKGKYKDVEKFYKYIKNLDETANAASEDWFALVEDFQGLYEDESKLPSKAQEEKSLKNIIAFVDDYEKKNPDCNKSIIEYFKFSTYAYAEVYGAKVDKSFASKYLKSAYESAGEYGYIYASAYVSYAYEDEKYDEVIDVVKKSCQVNTADETSFYYGIKSYLMKKDFDSANEMCKTYKKYNPNSASYYSIQSEVLRRQGNYDAAVDMCIEGNKISQDSELLRQEAIAYMLMGKKDKALDAATDSYELEYSNAAYPQDNQQQSISLDILNTSALICKLCNDDETYDDIKSTLSEQGYDLDDVVKAVIKGDKTFEEVFTTGKGDLQ